MPSSMHHSQVKDWIVKKIWKKRFSSITDFNCWAPTRDQTKAAKMSNNERTNTTDHNEYRERSFVEIIEKNRIGEQKEQILDKKRKIWLLLQIECAF